MKLDLYNKVYELTHSLDLADEHRLLLKCDINTQREIFTFHKGLSICSSLDEKISVCVMNDLDLCKFNKFVDITGINYIIKDVTLDVVLGNFETDELIINTIINPFLEDNLTIDIILDKINIKGVDGLSEIDKKILEYIK